MEAVQDALVNLLVTVAVGVIGIIVEIILKNILVFI